MDLQENPRRRARRNCPRSEFSCACARAGGRPDHRRFFHSSHRQSDASMHEGLLGKQGKAARRMKRRRAVITGIGPITCIGMGVENFWKGILAEKSGITRISTFDTSMF